MRTGGTATKRRQGGFAVQTLRDKNPEGASVLPASRADREESLSADRRPRPRGCRRARARGVERAGQDGERRRDVRVAVLGPGGGALAAGRGNRAPRRRRRGGRS